MAVTQIWRASRMRVRALLNAQALLNDRAGTPGGVALIEDDRRRMAARRTN